MLVGRGSASLVVTGGVVRANTAKDQASQLDVLSNAPVRLDGLVVEPLLTDGGATETAVRLSAAEDMAIDFMRWFTDARRPRSS